MSEVLSQAEIDALLSALSTGEVRAEDILDNDAAQKIRVYDFRRAMRFSKDHIRIIHRIHEHFARLLTTHLSGQLRSIVQIQVESVDQVPYEEFVRSMPVLTVVQVMEFSPLEGKVAVEMNPQIVFAMLDRLMGGIIQGPYKERELTEIEVALLNRVLRTMSDFFAEAWHNVADLQPELVSMESNPQFLQLTTPNETVLVVTMSARVGSSSGLLNICIPHITIKPLIPKLSTQYFMGANKVREVPKEDAERITSQIRKALVNVSVQLGTTEATVEELMNIEPGDIISLNASIYSPVTVFVDEVPSFVGSLGKSKHRSAVKILGPWKEDNGNDGRF